jgi:hypothetical protein
VLVALRRALEGKAASGSIPGPSTNHHGHASPKRNYNVTDIYNDQITDARLRLLAEQIHRLGPRPLYEFLKELFAGADLGSRLEAYARIAPLAPFIAELNGDQARELHLVNGGRQ